MLVCQRQLCVSGDLRCRGPTGDRLRDPKTADWVYMTRGKTTRLEQNRSLLREAAIADDDSCTVAQLRSSETGVLRGPPRSAPSRPQRIPQIGSLLAARSLCVKLCLVPRRGLSREARPATCFSRSTAVPTLGCAECGGARKSWFPETRFRQLASLPVTSAGRALACCDGTGDPWEVHREGVTRTADTHVWRLAVGTLHRHEHGHGLSNRPCVTSFCFSC